MNKYAGIATEATMDVARRYSAQSDKASVPGIALEYVAALSFAEHTAEDLPVVKELLREPGRINSVWVGIILERHVGSQVRAEWTEFCRPYREEGRREDS